MKVIHITHSLFIKINSFCFTSAPIFLALSSVRRYFLQPVWSEPWRARITFSILHLFMNTTWWQPAMKRLVWWHVDHVAAVWTCGEDSVNVCVGWCDTENNFQPLLHHRSLLGAHMTLVWFQLPSSRFTYELWRFSYIVDLFILSSCSLTAFLSFVLFLKV